MGDVVTVLNSFIINTIYHTFYYFTNSLSCCSCTLSFSVSHMIKKLIINDCVIYVPTHTTPT